MKKRRSTIERLSSGSRQENGRELSSLSVAHDEFMSVGPEGGDTLGTFATLISQSSIVLWSPDPTYN